MDRRLVNGVKRGVSRSRMARRLGVSRNAAIARYARLVGVVFPSEIRRIATRQYYPMLAAGQAAQRAREQYRIIDQVNAGLASGIPRDTLICGLRAGGALLQDIADAVDLSHERVRQITTATVHKSEKGFNSTGESAAVELSSASPGCD
jgi:hypothetical protein